jgi:hypothetical protein
VQSAPLVTKDDAKTELLQQWCSLIIDHEGNVEDTYLVRVSHLSTQEKIVGGVVD